MKPIFLQIQKNNFRTKPNIQLKKKAINHVVSLP
jgi:hypothetical protein